MATGRSGSRWLCRRGAVRGNPPPSADPGEGDLDVELVEIEARLEGETRWYKVDSDRATTQGWWAINHWPPPGSCRTYRATFGGDSVFAGKSRRTIWSGCS